MEGEQLSVEMLNSQVTSLPLRDCMLLPMLVEVLTLIAKYGLPFARSLDVVILIDLAGEAFTMLKAHCLAPDSLALLKEYWASGIEPANLCITIKQDVDRLTQWVQNSDLIRVRCEAARYLSTALLANRDSATIRQHFPVPQHLSYLASGNMSEFDKVSACLTKAFHKPECSTCNREFLFICYMRLFTTSTKVRTVSESDHIVISEERADFWQEISFFQELLVWLQKYHADFVSIHSVALAPKRIDRVRKRLRADEQRPCLLTLQPREYPELLVSSDELVNRFKNWCTQRRLDITPLESWLSNSSNHVKKCFELLLVFVHFDHQSLPEKEVKVLYLNLTWRRF